MNAKELLEAAKRAQNISSNYRLARVLGVPDNTVTRWHTGKNAPGNKYAAKLAELAGMDPGAVVAAMQAESVTDPDEKALWEGIATRLGKLMSVCAAVILSLFITGGPNGGAMAATPGAVASISAVDNQGGHDIHCRLMHVAAFFWAVRAFFTGLVAFSRNPATA